LKTRDAEKKAITKASPLLKALEPDFERLFREFKEDIEKIVGKGEPQFAMNILFHVMCKCPRTPLSKLFFHLMRLPKDRDCPILLLDKLIKWVLRHRPEFLSLMVLSGGNIHSYSGSHGFALSEKRLQELVTGKPWSCDLLAKIASEVESFQHLADIQIAPGLFTFTDCSLVLKTATSLMAAFGIMDGDLRSSAVASHDIPLTSIEPSGTKNVFFGSDCNMGSLQNAVACYASHDVPLFVKRSVIAGIDACYKTLVYAETNPSLYESLPANLFAGDGSINATL